MNKKAYLSDDHEDFRVDDHDTILHVLKRMTRRDVVLSGVFNGGADVLMTAVVDVNPKERAVYLDINANEERNQEFLSSDHVIFHSNFDGVKVKWTSRGVADGELDGRRAFRIQMPETLQRIQRRNSYRVSTPVTNPVICRIPLQPKGEIALRLVDISVEGIGVILPEEPEPAIQKHAEFMNCRIQHPDLGDVRVTLRVQNTWEVELRNGSKSKRAGLEFVNISTGAESVIQRFVYKLERILISTSRGG